MVVSWCLVLSLCSFVLLQVLYSTESFTITRQSSFQQQQCQSAFTTQTLSSSSSSSSFNDDDVSISAVESTISSSDSKSTGRREMLNMILAASTAGTIIGTIAIVPESALASGGATAGKYTTIPIAKRRYYGRVQQAVHEFLVMGPDVVIGDMTKDTVQHFFDPQGAIIIPAKRTAGESCIKKADGQCKGGEVRDSRYNDMKTSMYLLGNAFRTDQQKPPDRLPTVKAARAFFKQMDEMEKRVKKAKTKDVEAQQLYATAYSILDEYLDLVELPPIDSGHYDEEFDTLVGETARIT